MLFWRSFILVKINNEKIATASLSIKRKDLRKLSGDPLFPFPFSSCWQGKRNENFGFAFQLSTKNDWKFMKHGGFFIENTYYFSTSCLA